MQLDVRSWTQLDYKALVGSNINAPNRCHLHDDHATFGCFKFYLDKETVRHFCHHSLPKLGANSTQMFPTSIKRVNSKKACLSNGSHEVNVKLPALDELSVGVPPMITSSFALSSLQFCISAGQLNTCSVESHVEMERTLHPNGETDFVRAISSVQKFAITAQVIKPSLSSLE
jgi:hypothetical protein